LQGQQGKKIWEILLKAFKVINPGIHTTIQDQGRYGFMKYGIPPSGAMDQYSYMVGNLLLGNSDNSASLEITLHGLIIEAIISVTIAITGGNLCAYLNDHPAPQWAPVTMEKRDILYFKRRKEGFRAYLAVGGGFNTPEILGSKSTFIKGGTGMTLRGGEILSIGNYDKRKSIKTNILPRQYGPEFNNHEPILVVMGPQEEYFTSQGIDTFLNSTFKITPQSDRMAYRTDGPPIKIAKGPGIISDPIPRGAIQVPGDGKPIILLRDAQVTGGYAKIATVISADMDRLGQMMPGDKVRFRRISREMAIELLIERKRELDKLKELLIH
jgi:antagonist of KipI